MISAHRVILIFKLLEQVWVVNVLLHHVVEDIRAVLGAAGVRSAIVHLINHDLDAARAVGHLVFVIQWVLSFVVALLVVDVVPPTDDVVVESALVSVAVLWQPLRVVVADGHLGQQQRAEARPDKEGSLHHF